MPDHDLDAPAAEIPLDPRHVADVDPLDIVGGNGKYQWTRFLCILPVYSGTTLILCALTYLTLLPDVECRGAGGAWKG